MMKKIFAVLMSLGILVVPLLAFAQDFVQEEGEIAMPVPPPDSELLTQLIAAFQGGKWSLAVSLLIMTLVWAVTKAPVIRDWIKGEAKIWVAAIAGVLSAFATALWIDIASGAESIDWVKVILEGLGTGLAAGGLWSLIGRRLTGKKLEGDEAK